MNDESTDIDVEAEERTYKNMSTEQYRSLDQDEKLEVIADMLTSDRFDYVQVIALKPDPDLPDDEIPYMIVDATAVDQERLDLLPFQTTVNLAAWINDVLDDQKIDMSRDDGRASPSLADIVGNL